MTRPALTIVDQDSLFGKQFARYLGYQGLQAVLLRDIDALLHGWQLSPPSLLILGEPGEADAILPALLQVRNLSRVPCIVITSDPDQAHQIATLEAGADDVIEREMPLSYMLARIRTLLRRAQWSPEHSYPLSPPAFVAATVSPEPKVWRLNVNQRRLLRPNGQECYLTTSEFDLMHHLVKSGGATVSREDISLAVLRRHFRPPDRSVDNAVFRLRLKLRDDQGVIIKSVRTVGYMFAGFANAQILME